MQVPIMNRKLLFRIALLLILCVAGFKPVHAQFLQTRISLPPGIEMKSVGLPGQILPQEDSKSMLAEQMVWVELRAMVNLQLVVEYEYGKSLFPKEGELLILNDGSENFGQAKPLGTLGFVLIENPRKTIKKVGLRPYSAWLRFPFQSRAITTIHYP